MTSVSPPVRGRLICIGEALALERPAVRVAMLSSRAECLQGFWIEVGLGPGAWKGLELSKGQEAGAAELGEGTVSHWGKILRSHKRDHW